MTRAQDAHSDSRRPTRSSLASPLFTALGIGLLLAAFLYFGRAPVGRVVGMGIVVTATSFVLLRAVGLGRIEWPEPSRAGVGRVDRISRWRMNGFDAAVERTPGFSPHLRVRLSELADAILARYGLEPDSPGAVALLGSRTYQLLHPAEHRGGRDRPEDPVGNELVVLIDRLIELDARSRAHPSGTTSTARDGPTTFSPTKDVLTKDVLAKHALEKGNG